MVEQIIIILILIFFPIYGLLNRDNKNTIRTFAVGHDKKKWFPIAAGISMTFAGGAATLNMASMGYVYKWYPLVDPLSVVIGISIVLFFVALYYNDKGLTIANLLSNSNKTLTVTIGLVSAFVYILFVAAQFVALSKLLSQFFPTINNNILIIVPSFLIYLYVFLGGFKSVTKTDIIQLIMILLFLVLPILFFSSKITHDSNTISQVGDLNFEKMPLNLIILFSLPLLFVPFSQDLNIRIKASKNIRNAKIGLILGTFFYFLIIFASVLIGIVLKNRGVILEDSETALPYFFNEHLPIFSLFATLAVLAAIISTLDSYALSSIITLSNDVFQNLRLKKFGEKKIILIAGSIIFIIALIIALYFNVILGLILTALLIYVSILFPLSVGKYLNMSDRFLFITTLISIVFIIVSEITSLKIEPKAIVYPSFNLCLILIGFLIMKIRES